MLSDYEREKYAYYRAGGSNAGCSLAMARADQAYRDAEAAGFNLDVEEGDWPVPDVTEWQRVCRLNDARRDLKRQQRVERRLAYRRRCRAIYGILTA